MPAPCLHAISGTAAEQDTIAPIPQDKHHGCIYVSIINHNQNRQKTKTKSIEAGIAWSMHKAQSMQKILYMHYISTSIYHLTHSRSELFCCSSLLCYRHHLLTNLLSLHKG
jgi:hypothetical protein